MEALAPRDRRVGLAVLAMAATAGILATLAAGSPKVGFYVDRLDRSGLLYVGLALSLPALVLALRYPRAAPCLVAFFVPFNAVGGEWGDGVLVSAVKVLLNLLLLLSVGGALAVQPSRRVWLTRTPLGFAVVSWLTVIALGILAGIGVGDPSDWIRESNWMTFYLFALAVGTLIDDPLGLRRIVASATAGAALMQAFAFYRLATGTRYERADSWSGGASFFRAPFSSATLFPFFLALSAVLLLSARRRLTWTRSAALLLGIVAFGGGLLASMGRSLWISAIIGILAILALGEWNRRTIRTAIGVTLGIALAIAMVAAVDRLSPSSSGNWAANALDFLLNLGSGDNASTAGRRLEWAHALDVWGEHPLLGAGFGYPFPDVPYNINVPDKFYMHNSYLNVLAKCGAFGMAVFAALVAITGVRGWQTARDRDVAPGTRIIATAVFASTAQMASLAFFSPVITTTDSILFFAMLIGLTAALSRIRAEGATA